MKISEVLTEAGLGDALKAIAKEPRILANPGNIEAAANRLRGNRDVANFTQQMVKVWNNVVDQERKKRQAQAQGFDGGKMPEEDYVNLLKKFVSDTILGTPTNRGIDLIIQDVVKAADAGDANAFKTNFEELVSNALMIRAMTKTTDSRTQQQPGSTSNSEPPPRTVNQVVDALNDAGVRKNDLAKIKAAISSLSGIQPIRTQDTTARALLQAMGIPVA